MGVYALTQRYTCSVWQCSTDSSGLPCVTVGVDAVSLQPPISKMSFQDVEDLQAYIIHEKLMDFRENRNKKHEADFTL